MMAIERLSAFAISDQVGGNPAGVMVCEQQLPSAQDMQRIAADVGYSETVFSCRQGAAWRTRYFSPINEVPFCGHATIALGAVLAKRHGSGSYRLQLNGPEITVEGTVNKGALNATLTSAPTSSSPPADSFLAAALALFDLTVADLNPALPPVIADAGARHLILALKSRERLAAMQYELDKGKQLMDAENLITIMLVQAAGEQQFSVRNPFASGGVWEDPATGAAAAAFGGYLNKIGWPHGSRVEIQQGEDMGMPSQLIVHIDGAAGAPVRVGGRARFL